VSIRYQEFYITSIFEQIEHDFGDLATLVMGDCTENGLQLNNPHFIDEFCRRIGLDEYKNYDQVIRHVRENKNLHDFWIL
jgi:hypothetical protein